MVYSELGHTLEAYAIQRKPVSERWSREDIEQVRAYPWDWDPAEEVARDEVRVIPGLTPEELRERAMRDPEPEADEIPP